MANFRGIVSGWDSANSRPKGVVSPADLRNSLGGLARAEGIMLETGAAVVSRPSTSMSIGWTAFTAVISAPSGGWYCPRIGAGSIKLSAGHASYDRIDVVYVRQWDYQVSGDHPDSEVQVAVVRGTPAASPAVPAVPSGALGVFQVRVPKGATTGSAIPARNVTRCRWTTPTGGILTAGSQAEANALVSGVSASADNPVYVSIAGVMKAWNGTTWQNLVPPQFTAKRTWAGKGSAENNGSPLRILGGQYLGSTDQAGQASIAYGETLSAVLSAQVTSGDWNSPTHVTIQSISDTRIVCGCMGAGSKTYIGHVRINWLVIGW